MFACVTLKPTPIIFLTNTTTSLKQGEIDGGLDRNVWKIGSTKDNPYVFSYTVEINRHFSDTQILDALVEQVANSLKQAPKNALFTNKKRSRILNIQLELWEKYHNGLETNKAFLGKRYFKALGGTQTPGAKAFNKIANNAIKTIDQFINFFDPPSHYIEFLNSQNAT